MWAIRPRYTCHLPAMLMLESLKKWIKTLKKWRRYKQKLDRTRARASSPPSEETRHQNPSHNGQVTHDLKNNRSLHPSAYANPHKKTACHSRLARQSSSSEISNLGKAWNKLPHFVEHANKVDYY